MNPSPGLFRGESLAICLEQLFLMRILCRHGISYNGLNWAFQEKLAGRLIPRFSVFHWPYAFVFLLRWRAFIRKLLVCHWAVVLIAGPNCVLGLAGNSRPSVFKGNGG